MVYVLRTLSTERSLIIAIQIVSIANSQDVTVSLIEPNPILHLWVGSFTTFNTPIDNIGNNSVTRDPTSLSIGSRGLPSAGDNIVA